MAGCSLISTYQSRQGFYKPMQALIRPLSTLVCTYKTEAFLLMQVLCLAVSLTGSSTIIALSGWSDLSVTCSSKLGTYSGWGATTFGVVVEHDLHS